jgi:tRNA-2-methylthio-N6-dimethylallyladenosine synthase
MLHFSMARNVYIHTFGCQMNVHDSEKMLGILEKKGYSQTDSPGDADLIIFNTCSIRQKAEQKFFSELGRIKSYKKRNPDLKIAVAGCIAQQEGKNIFRKAPHVDFVFGPQNIHILGDLVQKKIKHFSLDINPCIATEDLPVKREDDIKAWVTIMYGCNNFCSYCIVPYTRGKERSRPSKNIFSEVSELAEKGYKEVTLLGQNVNSYHSDIDFPGLLMKLNSIEGLERIRFVTSHPKDLSGDLIRAMSDLSKVCEHIHLPLQSGSSKILRHMNRAYTYNDYMKKVVEIRNRVKGISLTSDIIAGFPGETDEDHMQTVKALQEIEFDGIFAFKYSPRPGTKAAEMHDHLPEDIRSERLEEILKIQDDITLMKNRYLEGTVQEMLLEGAGNEDPGTLTGRTRTNKIVNITSGDFPKGSIINVEITRGRKHSLDGTPVKE